MGQTSGTLWTEACFSALADPFSGARDFGFRGLGFRVAALSCGGVWLGHRPCTSSYGLGIGASDSRLLGSPGCSVGCGVLGCGVVRVREV